MEIIILLESFSFYIVDNIVFREFNINTIPTSVSVEFVLFTISCPINLLKKIVSIS